MIQFFLRTTRFLLYKIRYFYFLITHLHMRLLEPLTTVVRLTVVPLSFFLFGRSGSKRMRRGVHKSLIYFFPYDSTDCVLQHAAVGDALAREMIEAKLVAVGAQRTADAPDEDSEGVTFEDFDELVLHLVEFSDNDPNLARGVIDEFIRSCPLKVFQGNYLVPLWFLDRIRTLRFRAKDLVSQADGIVLADSAYTFNRALRSEAKKSNKPAFALNPHGQWCRLTQGEDENTSSSRFLEIVEQLLLNTYPYAVQAERYLDDRFSGRSLKDLDSATAFVVTGKTLDSGIAARKKVLFLHSFRDASGNHFPISPNELFFPTYFQWADAAIELISQQQDQWLIKPHPSQAFYANDFDILQTLLKRYRIDAALIKKDLPTKQVLELRWPVYTCSGTIAKEAACHGYKAHTVSRQIPDAITQRALSKDEFRQAYLQPISEAVQPIESTLFVQAAQMLTFEQFSGLASMAYEISPSRPVLPSVNTDAFYRERYAATFFMAKRLFRRSAVESAEQIATEISQAVGA